MSRVFLSAGRLAVGLAAVALAISAQLMIVDGGVPQEGIIRYSGALILMVIAFANTDAATFAGGRLLSSPEPAARDAPAWRTALVVVAILLGALGAAQFLGKNNEGGWLLFVCSVAAYGAALVETSWKAIGAAEKAREEASGGWWPATLRMLWAGAPVALLVVLALAVRMPMLGEYPFGVWYDEAAVGIFARRILEDPAFRPVCCEPITLPAHFQYLAAMAFSVVGVGVYALRLLAVAFGVLTVVLSYFLFRRWFGPRLGFVAAALWACMRYMIIWSRLGNDWVSPLAFETLILLLFEKALETKQARDFGWAGLATGLSLGFYYPNRLFLGVVGLYGAILAAVWVIRRLTRARRGAAAGPNSSAARLAGPAIAACTLGLLLGAMPVLQFAAANWTEFTARQATVSIFTKRDEPDLGKALRKQVDKSLLMFNARGDGNPRHNYPGEPMLDPILGALAALGLAHALIRFYRPANALMLTVFAVMLSGAIFSVDFEAPQSLRAIGVQPALIYFAVTPIALIGRVAGELLGPLWTRDRLRRYAKPALSALSALALAGGVAGVGRYNLDLYYGKERNAMAVYTDHSTAETITAYEINRLARDYDLVVSTAFYGTPTVQFLAPETVKKALNWSGSDPLDFSTARDRGIAILVEPRLSPAYNQLRRLFPDATFRKFVPPMGGTELVLEALISPQNARAAQGLLAAIYPGGDFSSPPAKQVEVSSASVDWTTQPPVSGPFGAELRGALNVTRDGPYTFAVRGLAAPELFIDEFPVGTAPVALARGLHALRLRATSAGSKFDLLWQPAGGALALVPSSTLFKPPAAASGLLARYYRNAEWRGDPVFAQVEPEINFAYHILPLPRPYSIEWTGQVYAPHDGAYVFTTESRDESFLFVGDRQIIANTADTAPVNATVTLTRGWHPIRMRFADKSSFTQVRLYWTPPGGGHEIIPFRYLSPPMGAYPDADVLAALPEPGPVQDVIAQSPGPGEGASARRISVPTAQAAGLSLELPRIQLPVIQLPQVGSPAAPKPAVAPSQAPVTPQGRPGAGAPPTPVSAPALALDAPKAIGKFGAGPGDFNSPHGVAIAKDGRVFIADTGNKRVQALDPDGHFLFAIVGGSEPFVEPYDLLFSPSGELLVLDSDAGWIYRFDTDGKPLGRMAGVDLRLYKPRGFGADAQGNLYIADTGRSRVIKLSPSGELILQVGSRGNGPLEFIEPGEVAVAPSGDIYVTDLPNRRVQRLKPDLSFAGEFAIPQAGPAAGPYIAFASDGSLLITAPEPNRIQRYSTDGRLIGEYRSLGEGVGGLRQPTGIAAQASVIWVAETANHRAQRFIYNP